MDKQNCIRDVADLEQINRCRTSLSDVEPSINHLSDILKLAGNDVRLKILFLLTREEKLCPCDLGDILNMNVPAISQHLRKLKDGGLVETEREGKVIFYSLALIYSSLIKSLLAQIENNKIFEVTAA